MLMKRAIAASMIALPLAAISLLPTPASASELVAWGRRGGGVFFGIGPIVVTPAVSPRPVYVAPPPGYYAPAYSGPERFWVPGHWEYTRFGERYWVRGHYEYR
jgi:hypothetical protein